MREPLQLLSSDLFQLAPELDIDAPLDGLADLFQRIHTHAVPSAGDGDEDTALFHDDDALEGDPADERVGLDGDLDLELGVREREDVETAWMAEEDVGGGEESATRGDGELGGGERGRERGERETEFGQRWRRETRRRRRCRTCRRWWWDRRGSGRRRSKVRTRWRVRRMQRRRKQRVPVANVQQVRNETG